MLRCPRRTPRLLALIVTIFTIFTSVSFLSACGERHLEFNDLTAPEREFVTHFVVLERARAVALAQPAVGAALLDSLAAAWGDSANVRARGQVPAEPARAAAVYDLLMQILAAEADSLVQAPVARRLAAPLPRGIRPEPTATTPPVDEG